MELLQNLLQNLVEFFSVLKWFIFKCFKNRRKKKNKKRHFLCSFLFIIVFLEKIRNLLRRFLYYTIKYYFIVLIKYYKIKYLIL